MIRCQACDYLRSANPLGSPAEAAAARRAVIEALRQYDEGYDYGKIEARGFQRSARGAMLVLRFHTDHERKIDANQRRNRALLWLQEILAGTSFVPYAPPESDPLWSPYMLRVSYHPARPNQ